MISVPFVRPWVAGDELRYIGRVVEQGRLAADGYFTQACSRLLEKRFGIHKVLMTPSCTAALEMAVMLCGIEPGDEVIMPSYNFVSMASAVVRQGARPVFVDVRPDTLNIDETLVEEAVTPRTRAIVPVHYAGVSCAMNELQEVARRRELLLIEDAAQGVGAWYGDKALGSMGAVGTYSFHDTKNITCGEGGALLINDPALAHRAEVIRDKGTNRQQFLRGEVQKYSWVDVGSSFVPSELVCAYLYAQLKALDEITQRRGRVYARYREGLRELEAEGHLELPRIPPGCSSNSHIFYILLPDTATRAHLASFLGERGVSAVFHYVPLHSSPMGRRLGCDRKELPVTDDLSRRLLRLPIYCDLTEEEQETVISGIRDFMRLCGAPSNGHATPVPRPVARNGRPAATPATTSESKRKTPAKVVAVVQSNYIPWKGYFDLIHAADEFILLDDVQYTRRDWRNRNRIQTHCGPAWLSIPVEAKGKYLQTIRETRISDRRWTKEHWSRIRHCYSRARHFKEFDSFFEELYLTCDEQWLSPVNRRFIEAINAVLGIGTKLSSSADYEVAEGKCERLVSLCRQAGATTYLSGPAAACYLDEEMFRQHGIDVEYWNYSGYPEYTQVYKPYEHSVTALDLIFNEGEGATKFMKSFSALEQRTA